MFLTNQFFLQYDEHLTQLESKISLAQEKAMQDDDQTWMGGDDENYTIAEPDRSVGIVLCNKKWFQAQFLCRAKLVRPIRCT